MIQTAAPPFQTTTKVVANSFGRFKSSPFKGYCCCCRCKTTLVVTNSAISHWNWNDFCPNYCNVRGSIKRGKETALYWEPSNLKIALRWVENIKLLKPSNSWQELGSSTPLDYYTLEQVYGGNVVVLYLCDTKIKLLAGIICHPLLIHPCGT